MQGILVKSFRGFSRQPNHSILYFYHIHPSCFLDFSTDKFIAISPLLSIIISLLDFLYNHINGIQSANP